MQSIQSNYSAFAAIRCDGTVVVWGSPNDGGDSSAVQVSGVPKKNVSTFCHNFNFNSKLNQVDHVFSLGAASFRIAKF